MKISKPIEIVANNYTLRLEGSVLTVTAISRNVHANPAEEIRWPSFDRMTGGSYNGDIEGHPWDIVADLMREVAKDA